MDSSASKRIKVVSKAVRALPFSCPTTADIITATKTGLDAEVFSAILGDALRLLPPDDTPDGQAMRKTEMALKASHALRAGTAFISSVRRLQPLLLDESQQQERIKAAVEQGATNFVKCTPDILFLSPTWLCDQPCHWVEYKNTFGFKSSPFLHLKQKKQLRRYVAAFGSGMVVDKLGYECDLFAIDGLFYFREEEVLRWINSAVLEKTETDDESNVEVLVQK